MSGKEGDGLRGRLQFRGLEKLLPGLLQSCIPTSPGHCSVDPVLWRNMLSCAQSQQTLRSSPGAKDLWNKITPVPEQLWDCQSMIPSRTIAPACPCFSTSSLAGLHSSARSKQLIENRVSLFPILNHLSGPSFSFELCTLEPQLLCGLERGFIEFSVCVLQSGKPVGSAGERSTSLGETQENQKRWQHRPQRLSACRESSSSCSHLGQWGVQFLFSVLGNESSCPYMLCFSSNVTS